MHLRPISICALALALSALTFATQSQAARGRVHVSDGKLLTDFCTPLRGAVWDIGDPNDGNRSRGALEAMKAAGFNAAHVYLSSEDPDERWTRVDDLVTWAGQLDLYVTITGACTKDHCFMLTSEERRAYSDDMWTKAAPRWGSFPHVTFEVQNEPVVSGNRDIWDVEIDREWSAYQIIRKAAPDTHVSLFCMGGVGVADAVANPYNAEDYSRGLYAAQEVQRRGVDYSNASVSMHMGGPWQDENVTVQSWPDAEDWALARELPKLGIPVFITESEVCIDSGFNCPAHAMGLFRTADELGIGWYSFYQNWGVLGRTWESQRTTASYTYHSDFGTVPDSAAERCPAGSAGSGGTGGASSTGGTGSAAGTGSGGAGTATGTGASASGSGLASGGAANGTGGSGAGCSLAHAPAHSSLLAPLTLAFAFLLRRRARAGVRSSASNH